MNIKALSAALGVALTTFAFTANAQKTYTSGLATYDTEVRGQPAEGKLYFTPDSAATIVTFGAGTFKLLTTAKHTYLAVILDIPVAGIKKAGVATPGELEEGAAAYPSFTFSPTTDTKTISGFNCKRVVAKNSNGGKTYDIWVTNDVIVPNTAYPFYYSGIGGYPMQFTYFQQGQELSITIKTLTSSTAPAGTFAIGKDFEVGTMADLGGN